MWTAPGETTCEDDDQVCMLQGSTRSSSPHHSSIARKVASWRKREYHLVPHHKCGSAMTNQAAEHMRKALAEHSGSGLPPPVLQKDPETMGLAFDSSMMQTPAPSCFAQFGRNPFEIVVSGYLYHMAVTGPETWLLQPFGATAEDCEPSFIKGRMINECKADSKTSYGAHVLRRGVAQVFNSSRSGSISAVLPDAKEYETYPQYLKRIDLDAGLLAESIWASDATLAPMRFTNDFMKSQPCSINVCFGEFYEDCGATWARVLRAWQLPEPEYSAMLNAAKKSCPHAAQNHVLAHSSNGWMKRQGLTHPPEHMLVKHLREMDRLHLNGKLAALEKHLGCLVSGKYTEPAPM